MGYLEAGLGLPIVEWSPGSTRISNSLQRNSNIVIAGELGVILNNLGMPGGWAGPANCGGEPREHQNQPFYKEKL